MNTAEKLAALRGRMKAAGVAAYLVPGTDPHQSEYLPACWERRAWVSGFNGSNGELLVFAGGAALWTDGRYFLQAEEQLAGTGIELMRMGEPDVPTVEAYLAKTLRADQALGVDARLISGARAIALEKAVAQAGARLECSALNLVDEVWTERPLLPCEPVRALAKKFAGEAVRSKLSRVMAAVRAAGAGAHVITMLDAIAWLFNIRGRDVDFNPVALAYAIVTDSGASLFIDETKLSAGVRRHLGADVTVQPYAAFPGALAQLDGKVLVEPATASEWVIRGLGKAQIVRGVSPIGRMKARKNEIELAGMRRAHRRDGAAMVNFLHWLDGAVPKGGVTEISAAEQLAAFRAAGEHFKGLSFRTISGYAAHGAIIHYYVTPKTDVPLKSKGLYLVDSGAQYLDGTTDITRTVALGERVGRAEKEAYTRVLKGHIALATAKFPKGVTGARLDTLARQYLWQAGLDYNHGTGHGVGAYLNVHEGPQSISPRSQAVALEAGNIQSNEPGYYEPGRFGIRIENLVEVIEDEATAASVRPMQALATLTLCPIDTKPIDRKLMSDAEFKWLNGYHRRVRRELSPLLDGPCKRWLQRACAPIGL
ncbi:MAG: M24 family metallopeptidase [Gammaproteobacteria bacterium]|nr:M24 family metallopeptidase [Gammaproteobacteria bacterium]